MPERPRKKRPADMNRLAFEIVQEAVGDAPAPAEPDEPEKNPHAVALGRLGGKKGGIARAKALSKKRRSEIARKAARTRWSKREASP